MICNIILSILSALFYFSSDHKKNERGLGEGEVELDVSVCLKRHIFGFLNIVNYSTNSSQNQKQV